MIRGRIRRACGAILLATVGGIGTALPASAADEVAVAVTLDGRAAATADTHDPIRLRPDDGVVISVQVTNNGTVPLEVRTVRFGGRMLGLAFFTYSTRVDLTVPPGGTGTRTFSLDLFDLGGQATGLLPAHVSLLDPERRTVATESFPVDVRGSIFSVYGLFGAGVAAITLLLLLGFVARLVSGRLPDNRMARAWRFLLPGVGLGLTLTLAASLVRAFVPSPGVSLLLMAIGAAAGFVAGYLSPRPGMTGDEDELDDRDLAVDAGYGAIDLGRDAGGGSRTTVVGGTLPPPPEQ